MKKDMTGDIMKQTKEYDCGYCKQHIKARPKFMNKIIINLRKTIKGEMIEAPKEPVFYCSEFCYLRGERLDLISKAVDSQTKGDSKCIICGEPCMISFCSQECSRAYFDRNHEKHKEIWGIKA